MKGDGNAYSEPILASTAGAGCRRISYPMRLGVVAVAATVRERPRLFVQCYTRTLISMPWDCGQIKRRMPTRAIQGEHTERGVRR